SLGLEKLRALDAGDGEQIPTLREVLDLCDKRVGVNIELKGPDTARPVNVLLRDALTHGWRSDQFLLSSFYHNELARADRQFARGALFHKSADYCAVAKELGASAINLAQKLVTKEVVQEAHQQGFQVLVYTVNSREEMQLQKDLGVNGVFTNYPELFPGE
ncbi:MAG: glycerophosphoryl diester phosphodiesterase, partial [Dinoroseobacter sp.]